jgi:Na+/H+ antiporter
VQDVELVLVSLLVAVVVLGSVARVLSIPYPIVLVVGGLVMGFIPGLPEAELAPELVLVIFLPPLLYSAAFFADLRELKRNARPISLLAIGLVLVTMCTVAVVAHALVDGMSWGAAFTLGAIVAPTDPVAATAVARRLNVPRRLVNVIEGESLVNDGTALVAYRVAAAAAVGGTFSLLDASVEFVLGAIGGIAIGLAVGWVISEIRRRIDDVPIEVTISLLSGYAGYLPAEAIHASGVLAAVTVGIVLGWRAPQISTASMRLTGYAIWEILVFLLNALLFVLIGLQLPMILDGLAGESTATLLAQAAAVSLAVILTRIAWMNTVVYVVRALDRRPSQRARRTDWRFRMIGAWAGMRGSVSLAAALALEPGFPNRDIVLFLTFSVIFVTLVLQGLTLPAVIRRLQVSDDGAEEQEELVGRRAAVDAALARTDSSTVRSSTRRSSVR